MTAPNLIEKAFLLKKTVLFADINLDDLLIIADKLDSIETQENQIIFKEDQTAQHMYIITEGKIELKNSTDQISSLLDGGEIFGDEALFSGRKHSYKATAKSNGHLLALTKKHLGVIFSECPSVALHFLKLYAQKISCRNAK
ncbi:MAG: hypothetical protein S4CHLAM7_04530 [Chlamydiae bacterium]|nr:hypothetical protein [Chlamydiota bacterium]